MSSSTPSFADTSRDFDFLIGTWRTRQRRLKARLQDCAEWESFSATSRVQQLPGGIVNFDTLVAEAWRPGWVGMSMRVFNPVTRLWSIFWVTNEGGGIDSATGMLSSPVVGRFVGDEGLFEGDDVLDGQPIRVRFRWHRQGVDAARWEQSFSGDGGRSWELNWVMEFERIVSGHDDTPAVWVPAADIDCQVVELRRYTLHADRREELVDLFDREFVEAQEAVGMAVMAQFRDLDVPDRFVWLRGFADMGSRSRGLAAFYDGPAWRQHRDAANATMIDSDDVLLLRPAWPGAGMETADRRRPAGAVRLTRPGLVRLGVVHLREQPSDDLLTFCRDVMAPCLQRAGAQILGWYVTEPAVNDFPRLPVREGEPVLVGLAAFEDAAGCAAFVRAGAWEREVLPALSRWMERPEQIHHLVPTARSAVRTSP